VTSQKNVCEEASYFQDNLKIKATKLLFTVTCVFFVLKGLLYREFLGESCAERKEMLLLVELQKDLIK